MNVRVQPAKSLKGTLRVPGDKSISHRSLIFGALAQGETIISHILRGADVMSTQSCLQALGVDIEDNGDLVRVRGKGLKGLKQPKSILDCGNSGTTIRLLMGVLAGQSFSSEMTGDQSLCRRPMKRVSEPLKAMGAEFELTQGQYPPLKVQGRKLHGIQYELPMASAQVKSAVLLAGLFADGKTTVTGKIASRDHTEKMLPYFGVPLETDPETGAVTIHGGSELKGTKINVPGDPSSAAFWMGAAAIVPGGTIELENVLLNPTRTGFLNVVKRMGARVETQIESEKPEPVGKIRVSFSQLKGAKVTPDEVPSLIDEIPLLAVVATQAQGVTEVRGAEELRVKESDRIEAVAKNLRAMGVRVETFQDGLSIEGPQKLHGARIETFDDHRIAMAFSVAGLVAQGETEILNAECVSISYPEFFDSLRSVTGA